MSSCFAKLPRIVAALLTCMLFAILTDCSSTHTTPPRSRGVERIGSKHNGRNRLFSAAGSAGHGKREAIGRRIGNLHGSLGARLYVR